jgi:hypothetical protein
MFATDIIRFRSSEAVHFFHFGDIKADTVVRDHDFIYIATSQLTSHDAARHRPGINRESGVVYTLTWT